MWTQNVTIYQMIRSKNRVQSFIVGHGAYQEPPIDLPIIAVIGYFYFYFSFGGSLIGVTHVSLSLKRKLIHNDE